MNTDAARKTLPFILLLGILFQLFSGAIARPSGSLSRNSNITDNDNESGSKKDRTAHKIQVAKLDFANIATPFIVVLWVLLASLLKLGFHMTPRLSKVIPESCMIILLGAVLGGLLRLFNYEETATLPFFTPKIFFLFLLPPIVLEAGYFLHTGAFFDNIGTILLYAVVGTIFNTFTVGLTLYGTISHIKDITLLQYLLFSCLVAAVDPVAVLAVFEEVHVNEVLYILVFGESLLNDAVTVVLYRLFEALVTQKTVEVEEVFVGVAAFFVVSFGGIIIGIIWAFLTAFLTKYTDHVRVLEPIFVVCMSYMAYLTAELFHFSGIISIVTCAVIMKPYVEANISQKSRIPVKYFLKMASSLSETIIFMLLGVILFNRSLKFDVKFTLLTIVYITVYRCLGVVLLTWLANSCMRLNKLGKVDQFVMAYGGLRGAVAFSLATLIKEEDVPAKTMMETTAIVVVLFTVFIQGTTIKPIVDLLKVKRAVKRKEIMLGEVNDKMLDHLLGGVQDVIQHRGHYYWKNLYQHLDVRYLRRYFMRHKDDAQAIDETLLMVYRKISYREAIMAAQKQNLTCENDSETDEYGTVVKDRRRSSALAPCQRGDSEKFKDMYSHVQLAFLLDRPRKGTVHRFSRNNVLDETDIGDEALRLRRRSQAALPARKVSREKASDDEASSKALIGHRHKSHHKHGKHKHHHRGHKKHKRVCKKLSDIAEDQTPDSPPGIVGQDIPLEALADEKDGGSSSESDTQSESRDLPKLADLEPSSPTLDKRFTDVPKTAVVDQQASSTPDGVDETVM